MSRPLGDEAVLGELWDQGNAVGLDGWVGPGRGAGEVDDEAVRERQRAVQRALDQLAVDRKAQREDVLRTARQVITQYLATAEKWRYDRVVWAFAVMLGEIPDDTPEPQGPADHHELRGFE